VLPIRNLDGPRSRQKGMEVDPAGRLGRRGVEEERNVNEHKRGPEVPHDGVLGPVDALQVPRYAGHSTFARLPRIEDVQRHDVAIVGVPFDSGVTYRPGARFGPSYIRQGSRLLRPYNPALDIAPFAGVQVVDAGDIAATPFDIPAALEQIEAGVRDLSTDGRSVVLLGGDHTVALPALRALHAQYGPLAMVHFDAHLDTWDTYFQAPYTHGTPFRRAWDEGLLDPDHTMHVGIRGSLYSAQDLRDDADMGLRSCTPGRWNAMASTR